MVETLEMLTLDALEHAPEVWVVLTAREHLTREDCHDHLQQLRRAARRLWPSIEWFVQVEFQRRGALHLNLLVKNVPVEDAGELRRVLSERWCARVDAEPQGQWVGPVHDGGGLVRYLQKTLSHGLKQEQAPPLGWRGHRTSQSRGYLVRPAAVMREEARASLRVKRALRRASEAGHEAHDAELVAQEDVAAAEATEWSLRHVRPAPNRPVTADERRSVARPVREHLARLEAGGDPARPSPRDDGHRQVPGMRAPERPQRAERVPIGDGTSRGRAEGQRESIPREAVPTSQQHPPPG